MQLYRTSRFQGMLQVIIKCYACHLGAMSSTIIRSPSVIGGEDGIVRVMDGDTQQWVARVDARVEQAHRHVRFGRNDPSRCIVRELPLEAWLEVEELVAGLCQWPHLVHGAYFVEECLQVVAIESGKRD